MDSRRYAACRTAAAHYLVLYLCLFPAVRPECPYAAVRETHTPDEGRGEGGEKTSLDNIIRIPAAGGSDRSGCERRLQWSL